MTDHEKRQEILRLFDQLTAEEQESFVSEVAMMISENRRKLHVATTSGQFCGAKRTRSGASGHTQLSPTRFG